jgi:F-type H+-transporting ATPase subunit O
MLSSALRTARSAGIKTVATRSFAEASHAPLIQLHGLHARYANAAYVAASKAGQLDKLAADLAGLLKTSAESKQFSMFLENPMISRDVKTKYVSSLDKLSPLTRNLLVTMAGNARLNELPKVAESFAQLMKAKRGQVDAKIVSAEKLTDAQMKDIRAAMQSQVPAGKTIVLKTVTDPSIVGGLQVQIGDQFLDLSVKSRIEEISNMAL